MNFDCLSKAEVRERYRRAEKKKEIIGVLADLTLSSPGEMRRFLGLPHKRAAKWVPIDSRRPRVDEEKALELYEAGLRDHEIAKAVGVSGNTVCNWRRRMGLPSKYRDGTDAVSLERLRLYDLGMTDQEIAEETGYTKRTICEWRSKNGLPMNERQMQGGNDG